MPYSPIVAEFLYKTCHDVITKYKAGSEDPETMMKISRWLMYFRQNAALTDAQIKALSDYLGVSVVVPDAPDTYETVVSEIQSVLSQQSDIISGQADAIADLSQVTSTTVEDVQTNADAIADLSDVVSSLVPTE